MGVKIRPQIAPEIRPAVRALIQRDGRVLVQHKAYENGGVRYTLPGGKAEPGESLSDGLIRECQEEIGVTVEVGELLHVADFLKPSSDAPDLHSHRIEFVFRCSVPDHYEARNGPSPDRHQVGVIWLAPGEASADHMFPNAYRQLCAPETAPATVYLGWIR